MLLLAFWSIFVCCPGAAPAQVLPRIVGHRGLIAHAPENTASNFAAALQLHVGIEVDVRRTKDGAWVCMHDPNVERTTDGKGLLSDYTLERLRKLDAGGYLAPYYIGERVPTFVELIELLARHKDPQILIAVDLKVSDLNSELELVTLARRYGVLDHLLFIGLTIVNTNVREKLRSAGNDVQISVLAQTAGDLDSALADKSANWAYLRYVPGRQSVDQIHAVGKRVIVVGDSVAGLEYTNWNRARLAGVDAIMTDHPLECRRALHFYRP